MEEGYVLDHSALGGAGQQSWGKGKPERSFTHGTVPSGGLHYTVTTYRCCECGFLEAYAEDDD
jgi:hypothetical protein